MFAKFVRSTMKPSRGGVLKKFTTNTSVFNFTWDDDQWLKQNPISGNLWQGWKDNALESDRCHQRRVYRMCQSGVVLKSVEPLQLYAFERTFFEVPKTAYIFDDYYETEQSNVMAYKH